MKYFFAFLAFAMSFVSLMAAKKNNAVLSGFGEPEKFIIRQDVCSLSGDAKSFEVDSTKASDWTIWLRTADGVLEPNTDYIATFTYSMADNAPENAFFHVIVRPLSKITPDADCLGTNQNKVVTPTKVQFSFRTKEAKDYSFQIHLAGKFKGKIGKFKISKGSNNKFAPFTADEPPFTEEIKNIPTGAKEFTVDLPQPQNDIVVNAADFGLTPSCPNVREVINNAISHCKKIGASKLVINKGVYNITQDGPIKIDNMHDFTFDGGGSTFIYCKKSGCNFNVEKCERVKVCNFNFDWDWSKDPIASIVEIENIGKDERGNFIDIKFLTYEKFPKENVRFVIMTPYDPEAKSVGVEGRRDFNFANNDGRNNPPTKWLSPNTMRVWRIDPTFFAKGWQCRLVHYSYDMGCIVLISNKHFTMENVNIYSCCGNGVAIGGEQKYWQFINFNMVIPNDGNVHRCVTSSADHCHIINSQGYFKMENCELSYGCDDCINMHDCSAFGRRDSDTSIQGKRMKSRLKIGDTLEFRNGDFSPARFSATITDISPVDTKSDIWKVTFDKQLPPQKKDGFVLFNRAYSTSNIIVRNCYFHDNRARGLLILASDVTIENCRFKRNEQGGIKIETGYTLNLWCEGFGAKNIKISNNTFDTVNPTGTKNSDYERDIFIGTYIKSDPSYEHTNYPILSNILIEKNKFKDTFGLCAYIASAGNVIIRDNTFEATTARENQRNYRGSFFIRNSSNIKILNNIYKKSELFKDTGLIYDSLSSKNILSAGNRIEK